MLRDIFSPAEARQFVRLGLPVLIAQTTQMGMNFVDTAMTGQYGRTDMAAVAVAGSVWAPVSLLGVGCLLALPPPKPRSCCGRASGSHAPSAACS